ncbi:hypothetical protein TrST_g4215 [Triparma strigata]|uniref:Diaminopimelate decarboxylase n=1 Tax=Triparma strigata TaxID=1606541 RepID=A0A9W6ZJ88_9STRA|nr:hypothetical protein TrST_g4215 [Triparma strigata]
MSQSTTCSYRGVQTEDIPSVLKSLIEAWGTQTPTQKNDEEEKKSASSTDDLVRLVEETTSQKSAVVYDLDALRSTFVAANDSFGSHFVHALAAKACPLPFVLEEAVSHGLGVECASFGECACALAASCDADKIVFDSPAKTHAELVWALEHGITINADNLDELERIDSILGGRSTPSLSVVGLRINPIVTGGTIDMYAVSSTPTSKFGHPLHTPSSRKLVVDAFLKYPWLNAVHAHVGSAGTSIKMLAEGAAKVVHLADEIDAACGCVRIKMLDIGGGLACSPATDEVTPKWGDYAEALRAAAPTLFSNASRRVFTEFGRSMMLKSGMIVTRVEYAKEPELSGAAEQLRTAVVQCGADLMMRKCYNPGNNSHRISVYDEAGNDLTGEREVVTHNIAGPLCFAGDYLQKGVELPRLQEGDYVVIRDCGANTLSTFSRHCSRLPPPVWSFVKEDVKGGGGVKLTLQVEGGKVEEVLKFWSGGLTRSIGRKKERPEGGTCLIVVDVQPEYWSDLEPTVRAEFPDFPNNFARTLNRCRTGGTEIVWVRADYNQDASPWTAQFAELNPDKQKEVTCDTANLKWEEFAMPQRGELLVAKPSWGVKDTALLDWLKQGHFKEVLVCGLATSVCVQQTAFSLFEAGFKVSVVTDACADRSRKRHEAAVELYGGYMYHVVEGFGEGGGEGGAGVYGAPTVLTKDNFTSL